MSNKFIIINEEAGTISLKLPLPAGKSLLCQLLSTYLLTEKKACPCGSPDCEVTAGDKLWAQLSQEGADFLASQLSPRRQVALMLAIAQVAARR